MDRFVIRAGCVFDGERFRPGGTRVLVEGERVVDVGTGAGPGGWPVLDLPEASLLPGLVDSHVHLVGGSEPDALTLDAGRSAAEREEVVRLSLGQQLGQGVTAVRDLGDTRFAVIDRTPLDGEPTVVGSGPPITSPGGHCAAMGGAARGPEALRAAVRERAEHGAQVVKLVISGGAMTAGSDLLESQFDRAEVRAVVAEAHRLGLPVTAHAHSVPSVQACVDGGVDQIEHCTCLTDHGIDTPPGLLAALAERRPVVCPTFGRVPGLPLSPQADEINRRTGMSLAARFAQVGVLHRSGVPVLAGSDAGIHPGKPHGVLAYSVLELARSGLSATQALAAAASAAADACGLADRSGRLRPGAPADLLVVDGDLSADLAALTRPREVYLRGRPRSAWPGPLPGRPRARS